MLLRPYTVRGTNKTSANVRYCIYSLSSRVVKQLRVHLRGSGGWDVLQNEIFRNEADVAKLAKQMPHAFCGLSHHPGRCCLMTSSPKPRTLEG